MKKFLQSVGVIAALASFVPAVAAASPWNRRCGTGQDGFLLGGSDKWEVSGPFHIRMSYPTALSIDLRLPLQEFNTKFAVGDVPCAVAQDVAYAASKAWLHWPGNDGWAKVQWIGYSTGPYLGRVYCKGVSQADGGATETCHHKADGHAGAYTARFTISVNPYYYGS